MVSAVEKAIRDTNLGLNPATEGQVLRIRIPELNEQRRKEMVKVAHKYAEEARVAARHVRRDGLDMLKKLEKDGHVSKDDLDRFSEQVQKVDRPDDRRDRRGAGVEGKRDHAGLSARCLVTRAAAGRRSDPMIDRAGSAPAAIRRNVQRARSGPCGRSSWMATAAGRRRAACRGSRGIAVASRPCAVRCARPSRSGLRYLTVYSFSSENWRRPDPGGLATSWAC